MVRELAEAGVFGVAVPEDEGGLGMGLAAGGVIAEEVGRVIAPEPVVSTIGLSLGLLRRLCPDHPKMAQLIGGEISLAVAWQERGPDGAPDDATCRYADGKLTGSKAWVVGAIGSHGFLVVAEQDDGPVLVLAEADAQGLVIDKRTQADGSSLGELSFSGTPAAELASSHRLCEYLVDPRPFEDVLAEERRVVVDVCHRDLGKFEFWCVHPFSAHQQGAVTAVSQRRDLGGIRC